MKLIGLARSEVLDADHNSVSHDVRFIGTGLGLLRDSTLGFAREPETTSFMHEQIEDGIGDDGVAEPAVPVPDR